MTEPTAPQVSADGAPANGAPSAATDEFVITDAPLPDHSLSGDDEELLTSRSADRTERLKALATGKRGPGRPRKESTSRPTDKAPKRVAAMPRGGFTKQLEQLYVGIGMAVLFRDPECGTAIIEAAPKCAETLNALAEKNPAVRRILLAITQSSAIGAVVIAHAPILWALAKHHVPAVKDSGVVGLIDSLTATPSEPEHLAA